MKSIRNNKKMKTITEVLLDDSKNDADNELKELDNEAEKLRHQLNMNTVARKDLLRYIEQLNKITV